MNARTCICKSICLLLLRVDFIQLSLYWRTTSQGGYQIFRHFQKPDNYLLQTEIDVDGGQNFHWFTIQLRWLVFPLLHSFHRGRNEERRTADHFEVFDGAFL